MDNTNAVTTVQVADLAQYNPEAIATLKATIAVGATDQELSMLLTLAGKYQLDPFAREIYFMKLGDKPTIMTGRDGYLAIAQRDPDFEGLQSAAVRLKDKFKLDVVNGTVEHEPVFTPHTTEDPNPIVGAWAIAYRKGRKPAIVFAAMSEYRKSSGPWQQYPSAMIEKVAESRALKRQFSISGLVTQEEIEGEPVATGAQQKRGVGRPRRVEAAPQVAPTPAEEVIEVQETKSEAAQTLLKDIETVLVEVLTISGKDEMIEHLDQTLEASAQKYFKKHLSDLSEEELSTMLMTITKKLNELKGPQNDAAVEDVRDTVKAPTGNLSTAAVEAMFTTPNAQ